MDGHIIGMNTRAAVRNADLTVTKSTVERVVAELHEHGGIARGYLGVGVYPVRLPRALRDELEDGAASRRRGALVVAVQDNSAADAAGIVEGDILIAVDDDVVQGSRSLRAVLYARAGEKVHLALVRAGVVTKIEVELAERR